MPARWLALLCVLMLLPTIEVVEQGVHVVEHVVLGEPVGHDAHHDADNPIGEHGCTELVHVCGGHHGFGLAPALPAPVIARHEVGATAPIAIIDLHDLAAREPPHRPPIG